MDLGRVWPSDSQMPNCGSVQLLGSVSRNTDSVGKSVGTESRFMVAKGWGVGWMKGDC